MQLAYRIPTTTFAPLVLIGSRNWWSMRPLIFGSIVMVVVAANWWGLSMQEQSINEGG